MAQIDDVHLSRLAIWPEKIPVAKIRHLLAETKRFIDFDCTIAGGGGEFMQPTLCGVPTPEFLAQEPYIVQTWNPGAAAQFFTERFPGLPKPLLVIFVPSLDLPYDPEADWNHAKDFDALGVTGKIIIDDMPPHCIKATNCIHVHPSQPLPPQTANA